MNRARLQRRVVERVQSRGGLVTFDYELRGLKEPDWPVWLRRLLGDDCFRTAISVSFLDEADNTELSDADLQEISKLYSLKHLYLRNCRSLSGVGIASIQRLDQLQVLDLSNTDTPDDSLHALMHLTDLENLDLCETRITDLGVLELKKLPKLKSLALNKTEVSDAGLRVVSSISSLETLLLADTPNI